MLLHQHITRTRDAFTVSTSRDRLNLEDAYELLLTTFWGASTPLELFKKGANNSICFGLYHDDKLIGFARVISDLATYAYWADVVTDPAYRGQGHGQWLCECMLEHPDLQGLRRIGLLSRDAVSLYERVGFKRDTGTLVYLEMRPKGVL